MDGEKGTDTRVESRGNGPLSKNNPQVNGENENRRKKKKSP